MTAAHRTKTSFLHDWFVTITAFAPDVRPGNRSTPATAEKVELTAATDPIDDLIDKVDHGYLVQETGQRADLPRLARAHLKTAIRHGDV